MDTIDVLGMDEVAVQNTPVDQIDSELVNLIMVLIDQSGSMQPHVTEMQKALVNFQNSLMDSKEVDELLVARGNFYNYNVDMGGYKKVDQFDVNYFANGGTPLYDAIKEAQQKLFDYMGYLKNQGMRVKAVLSVFSDGDDTSSHIRVFDAKQCVDELNSKEVVTAFMGFGVQALNEAQTLGFKNVLDILQEGNRSDIGSVLRKAFDCLSKSVISNSQSATQKVDNFFTV
jgi:uncharacterized protein YegL